MSAWTALIFSPLAELIAAGAARNGHMGSTPIAVFRYLLGCDAYFEHVHACSVAQMLCIRQMVANKDLSGQRVAA
jgi:hypothetical protein